jgi:hypothetical protein
MARRLNKSVTAHGRRGERKPARGQQPIDLPSKIRRRTVHLTPTMLHNERARKSRDRALHVLAAMRRDSKLSLTRAAKLEGIKPGTVKKYFSSDLRKSNGKFRVTKGDRHSATLYLFDAHGNSVPIETRSSKERRQVGQFLRDLGRYQRGNRNALASWRGKKIAGIELVTDPNTIKALEPALSDFSIYRTLNGNVA